MLPAGSRRVAEAKLPAEWICTFDPAVRYGTPEPTYNEGPGFRPGGPRRDLVNQAHAQTVADRMEGGRPVQLRADAPRLCRRCEPGTRSRRLSPRPSMPRGRPVQC